MDAILSRSRSVLASETALSVNGVEASSQNPSQLILHDTTAIAGLGGPVGLLIAFSFEKNLLDAIFERFTDDIDVPDDEIPIYRREAAAEIINIILGHCTMDMKYVDQTITLSPPVVVDQAKSIRRPKDAVFANMRIATDEGNLDVSIVGPKQLFDEKMNYIKESAE